MKGFLKTTIVGGVIFLLPLALVLLVLSHAMRLANKVAQPLVDALGMDRLGHFAGIGAVTLVAVLVLIVLSFAAGIVARTGLGARISGWFERSLLGSMPQYQMFKSLAAGLAQVEGAEGLKPALVNIEDGWQLGYLLETLENGWVAVFLPQAPTPMAGNVMYLPTARVRPLDMPMVQAMAVVKHIGAGSADALRGVDMRLPQGA